MASQPSGTGYPPYNIEKTGDDAGRIVMAVAGFGEAELNLPRRKTSCWSRARFSRPATTGRRSFIGIAGRDFERRFQLADHVRVTGAKLALAAVQ